VLISLPVGLLLAVLFSLSRMSRRNEIISMLTAGVSVSRIMCPLIVVGLLATGALVVLNYESAPRAEAMRSRALEQIGRGRASAEAEAVNGYLFRDRSNGRTWFIKKFRPNTLSLDGVHITQQDLQGKIVKKWIANRAIYDPRAKAWTLNRGIAVDFNAAGDVAKIDEFELGSRSLTSWSETPWRIASSQLPAENLTVPELREYLQNNADFSPAQIAPYTTYLQHRLAVPFQCLVVVFIGAPLSIVFSRRGVVGGVAAAMLLYAALLISTFLFLALGKGARLDAYLAAWLPNALFLVIGLVLLFFRTTNRDFPTLSLRN
jgi:lipopolysaccharide export LptBFGC system permease protein LptF